MTKEIENPIEINLSELPAEGRLLDYSREIGELNACLFDVIGDHDYRISLLVAPVGNAFSVTGNIKTSMDLECCKCAMGFKFDVSEKVDEIFVIVSKRPRSSKSARVNHSTELDLGGPECTELDSPILHLGEFLRELIVLSEPSRPMKSKSCELPDACKNLLEAKMGGWAAENFTPDAKENSPFAALKDFKLNN